MSDEHLFDDCIIGVTRGIGNEMLLVYSADMMVVKLTTAENKTIEDATNEVIAIIDREFTSRELTDPPGPVFVWALPAHGTDSEGDSTLVHQPGTGGTLPPD